LNQSSSVSYNLALSIVGIAIALILSSLSLPGNRGIDADGKMLVGGAFIASCFFGISIALYPGWYRRLGVSGRQANRDPGKEGIQRGMRGHHPDCATFESHRVYFGERVFCAGCLGIMLGSILAMILMATYIGISQYDPKGSAQSLTFLGSIAILLVYLEVASSRHRVLHIVSNAALMIGLLLVTIGMLEATGSMMVGLLGVLFGFLWMNTRISLSGWRHALLCRKCGEVCKGY